MNTIEISAVWISENRQRREFNAGELVELGDSIEQHGLLQAIVLREINGGFALVAGERRLRAVRDLDDLGRRFKHDGQLVPPGQIPYVSLGELDELAREEAELEENLRRKDLTWKELAAATAKLSSLRKRQAEQRGEAAPVTADIATELRGSSKGSAQETTRREIIVARHLDNPEVASAKSLDDAYKALKREEDTKRRRELAQLMGTSYSAGTAHEVLNCDSLRWLREAAADQFDVICTDPPYGISADEFGDSGGKAAGAHFYKDDYETWKVIIHTLAQEGFRVTHAAAHLYCFCDITRFDEAKGVFAAAGWQVFRTPIIWHKPNGARTPWVEGGPQRQYELILYARKGSKPVTKIYPDLVSYPTDKNLGHPAQKPVAIYLDLLRRSVAPGDRVLDPFAGSGPVIPAAEELKVRATALELDPAAYGLCLERINLLKSQGELLV